ncbi:MAG: RNA 2',3'-cyclic phosphodiesterase, partial [Planctomycetes bacterium]|nr:RNA 2',3'-cyclic phosphodiesterase [Planctomycetota bacterium]
GRVQPGPGSGMRAFLAIEFPDTWKETYAEALPSLRERFAGVRWVSAENVHLTLRFLGEVSSDVADRLERPVEAIARQSVPLSLSIGEPGFFGPAAAPRVLWLAVADGRSELEGLQSRIEDAVRRLGLPADDKPFRPHVTLGRSRSGRGGPRRPEAGGLAGGPEWIEAASASRLPGAAFRVEEWTLLSSEITPRGPIYSPVWRVPLGASE